MQAPTCRLCGYRHWRSEACRLGDVPEASINSTPPAPKPSINTPQDAGEASINISRARRWQLRHPDRYRAYMRDYMRRRRAEAS